MKFSTSCLIRVIFILAAASWFDLAWADDLSPFFKESFKSIHSDISVRNSLKSLSPSFSFKNPSLATADNKVCSRKMSAKDLAGISKSKFVSKGITHHWEKGSTCPLRDMLLSLVLDMFTTRLPSLQYFAYQQRKTTLSTVVCSDNKYGFYLAVFLSLFSEQKVKECKTVTTKREGFATWEEYKKFIADLDKSITDIYDTIDGWVCRHEMTDKSLTYHTLFLRKAADAHFTDVSATKSLWWGKNVPATLHFLEAYPIVLTFVLSSVTKDIGEDAETLIRKLYGRSQITKGVMKTFGKKDLSKRDKKYLQKYCEQFKNAIPASA
ncbi:hypothetical protein TWF106_004239 [Orbilia oligospora]|uniref:Uncharacterized protein n=3 Tax=Orbilia oligospora TaxID=2813651 RepID=A0A6G1M7L7_ORBOL|nr:hypothetical protein TWF106_004239 [Orbilia oligospora]KAF3248830.1 hypothetical protein TWF192_006222 [Orbilia oligospora]